MNDQVVAADDCDNIAFWPTIPVELPPGILIEAVPFVTVAVTPAPTKSKYEADPCVLPSSKMNSALVPPPPPFKAKDAVKA